MVKNYTSKYINVVHLEEIKKKLDKNYGKMEGEGEGENNKIREKRNIEGIESNLVKNVIPKLEEFCEPSGKNTHFMRQKYVLIGRITNFYFRLIPRRVTPFEEIDLISITQTCYFLNID